MKRIVITLIIDTDESTALNILKHDVIRAVNDELQHRIIACELEEV